MTEQERFEQYKKAVKKPNMTIEQYRERVNRWQPIAEVVKNPNK